MSSVAETEFKLSREAVARAGWRRRYRCHQSGEHFVRFERSLGGRDGRAVSVRPLPRTSRQFFQERPKLTRNSTWYCRLMNLIQSRPTVKRTICTLRDPARARGPVGLREWRAWGEVPLRP